MCLDPDIHNIIDLPSAIDVSYDPNELRNAFGSALQPWVCLLVSYPLKCWISEDLLVTVA